MRSVPQEAMEERLVTVDEVSSPPPESFFVIATQNPNNQVGASHCGYLSAIDFL